MGRDRDRERWKEMEREMMERDIEVLMLWD